MRWMVLALLFVGMSENLSNVPKVYTYEDIEEIRKETQEKKGIVGCEKLNILKIFGIKPFVDVFLIGRIVKLKEDPESLDFPRKIWIVPDSIIWASEIKDTYFVKVSSGDVVVKLKNGRKIKIKMQYHWKQGDSLILPITYFPPYDLKIGEKAFFALSSYASAPKIPFAVIDFPFIGKFELLKFINLKYEKKEELLLEKERERLKNKKTFNNFYCLIYKYEIKGDSVYHMPEVIRFLKKFKPNKKYEVYKLTMEGKLKKEIMEGKKLVNVDKCFVISLKDFLKVIEKRARRIKEKSDILKNEKEAYFWEWKIHQQPTEGEYKDIPYKIWH